MAGKKDYLRLSAEHSQSLPDLHSQGATDNKGREGYLGIRRKPHIYLPSAPAVLSHCFLANLLDGLSQLKMASPFYI